MTVGMDEAAPLQVVRRRSSGCIAAGPTGFAGHTPTLWVGAAAFCVAAKLRLPIASSTTAVRPCLTAPPGWQAVQKCSVGLWRGCFHQVPEHFVESPQIQILLDFDEACAKHRV